MKRAVLYRSTPIASSAAATASPSEPPPARTRRFGLPGAWRQRAPGLAGSMALLLALLALLLHIRVPARAPLPDQAWIDAAVRRTFEESSLPSRTARAAEAVRQSVVRVRSFVRDPRSDSPEGKERGVGTGVMVVEDGTILTNLHVIQGADRLEVTFHDGSTSEAIVIAAQPEKDLAVIRAKTVPDDLPAATLGASTSLRPGDEVVAVGFPFGIGPSVSAGVVSGLQRAFRSPASGQTLSGLIQFDAAANPGNSGGPLVTLDGDVVGIVTAILNPGESHTFIGIGFATTIESAGSAVGIPPF